MKITCIKYNLYSGILSPIGWAISQQMILERTRDKNIFYAKKLSETHTHHVALVL